jgi:Protein of unknown function (DUF2867)
MKSDSAYQRLLNTKVKRRAQIEECEVPINSAIDRNLIDAAFFRDAYRTPLTHGDIGVVEIFFGVFGHHPVWIKWLLMTRNHIATWCGLDAPTRSEIMNLEVKSSYAVGDKIGPWPLFSLTENELVAGRDNKHLDFRLSVMKEKNAGATTTAISTVCTTHNAFGRVYLFFIIPFHKWGVRHLMSGAVSTGRL